MGLLMFSALARRRLRAPRRRVGTKRDATQHRAFRGRSRGRQRGRRGVGSEGGVREGDRAPLSSSRDQKNKTSGSTTRRAPGRCRRRSAPGGARESPSTSATARLPRRRRSEARHGAAAVAPLAIGIDHGRPAARHRAATAAAVLAAVRRRFAQRRPRSAREAQVSEGRSLAVEDTPDGRRARRLQQIGLRLAHHLAQGRAPQQLACERRLFHRRLH